MTDEEKTIATAVNILKYQIFDLGTVTAIVHLLLNKVDKVKRLRGALDDPTEEMKLAGARSIGQTMGMENHTERAFRCWKAMRAALADDDRGGEVA